MKYRNIVILLLISVSQLIFLIFPTLQEHFLSINVLLALFLCAHCARESGIFGSLSPSKVTIPLFIVLCILCVATVSKWRRSIAIQSSAVTLDDLCNFVLAEQAASSAEAIDLEIASLKRELGARREELQRTTDVLRGESVDQDRRLEREAWAVMLDSDDEQRRAVTSVIAHCTAIRRYSVMQRPIVLLVSAEREPHLLREAHRASLAALNVTVLRYQTIHYSRNRLRVLKNAHKLHLWNLIQYDKVVFLELDLIILRNLDFLFEYPGLPTLSTNAEHPSQPSTGIIVLEPSEQLHERMLQRLKSYTPTWDTSDAAFFDSFFTGYALLPWDTCATVRLVYTAPDLFNNRIALENVHCLRWSTGIKPWLNQKRHDLQALSYFWYDYLASHVEQYKVPNSDYVYKSLPSSSRWKT